MFRVIPLYTVYFTYNNNLSLTFEVVKLHKLIFMAKRLFFKLHKFLSSYLILTVLKSYPGHDVKLL